ncbi:hypothetical protein [Frondihabitans australicus]|uniref:Uncharacterized protein n=1 Tax=Frondihabitans australicus TaxID=386892 RepID=A0A495ILG5_9MICO|nr:hypothetical protein [Frondihabitans australicus]RKR76006.1 hypothetical protein C8E83_3170 [Frondihabitans australicus]
MNTILKGLAAVGIGAALILTPVAANAANTVDTASCAPSTCGGGPGFVAPVDPADTTPFTFRAMSSALSGSRALTLSGTGAYNAIVTVNVSVNGQVTEGAAYTLRGWRATVLLPNGLKSGDTVTFTASEDRLGEITTLSQTVVVD